MRRADRLFQLVQVLRTRRTATAESIARELGVSKRTVYRDIRDLEASGVPIRGEAGVGYRMDARFELPPLSFNAEELAGLALGARMVQTWADPELGASVRRAMTKVEAVLPEPMRRVLNEIALFAGGDPRCDVTRHMAPLRRAVSERRVLSFAYQRADGTGSQRCVRPLGLYFWGNKWTLAAWCELRDDYRSFRPDRMSGLEVLERRFEPDERISLATYLARVDEHERAWRRAS